MKIWEQGTVSKDCKTLTLNGDLFAIELVIDKADELMGTNIQEVHIVGDKNKVILKKEDLWKMKKNKTELKSE